MKNQELPRCLELADDGEIRRCQRYLVSALKAAGGHRKIKVGYYREPKIVDAWWFKKYEIWWAYTEESSMHRNVFGIADNMDESNARAHDITCEINPPIPADNWHPAGRFVRDGKGRYYIAHAGNFGGPGRWIILDDFPSWPTKYAGYTALQQSPSCPCSAFRNLSVLR